MIEFRVARRAKRVQVSMKLRSLMMKLMIGKEGI